MSAPTGVLDWLAVAAKLALSDGPCTTAELAAALGVAVDDEDLRSELAWAEHQGFVDYVKDTGTWVLVSSVGR